MCSFIKVSVFLIYTHSVEQLYRALCTNTIVSILKMPFAKKKIKNRNHNIQSSSVTVQSFFAGPGQKSGDKSAHVICIHV